MVLYQSLKHTLNNDFNWDILWLFLTMPLWYTEATGTQQKCIYSSSSHCSPWDFYQEHKLKMPNEERFESKCSKCHQRGLIQSTMKSAEIFQYTAIYLGLGPKSKFKPFQDFGQNDDTSKWESLGSNQSSTDKQVKITYSYESLPFFFFSPPRETHTFPIPINTLYPN